MATTDGGKVELIAQIYDLYTPIDLCYEQISGNDSHQIGSR